MKLRDLPLRDLIALEVLPGIVSRGEKQSREQVNFAYDVADAMLTHMAVRDHELEELKARAERAERTLEIMRPEWAKGYTSDSIAAQASITARLELWEILGVKDQTAACAKLRELVK